MICNKEDEAQPDIRARLVACELNTYQTDDFYASTPPLEAKRLLLSQMATQRRMEDGRPLELSFVDVKKAYFMRQRKERYTLSYQENTEEMEAEWGCLRSRCTESDTRPSLGQTLIQKCLLENLGSPRDRARRAALRTRAGG